MSKLLLTLTLCGLWTVATPLVAFADNSGAADESTSEEVYEDDGSSSFPTYVEESDDSSGSEE